MVTHIRLTLAILVVSVITGSLLLAAPANAASGKKAATEARVQKAKNRAVRAKRRELRAVSTELNGKFKLVQDLQSRGVTNLMMTTNAKAQMDALAQRKIDLKKEIRAIKKQTIAQFAQRNGIEYVPAPPSTPPPPLPGQLAVPTVKVEPGRASLPPGTPPGLSVQRSAGPQI